MGKMTKEEIYNQVIKTDDSGMDEMVENLIKEWEKEDGIKIPRDLDDETNE